MFRVQGAEIPALAADVYPRMIPRRLARMLKISPSNTTKYYGRNGRSLSPHSSQRIGRDGAALPPHFLAVANQDEGRNRANAIPLGLLLVAIDVDRANVESFAREVGRHGFHSLAGAAPFGGEH
jgi:hypothetical protein